MLRQLLSVLHYLPRSPAADDAVYTVQPLQVFVYYVNAVCVCVHAQTHTAYTLSWVDCRRKLQKNTLMTFAFLKIQKNKKKSHQDIENIIRNVSTISEKNNFE